MRHYDNDVAIFKYTLIGRRGSVRQIIIILPLDHHFIGYMKLLKIWFPTGRSSKLIDTENILITM